MDTHRTRYRPRKTQLGPAAAADPVEVPRGTENQTVTTVYRAGKTVEYIAFKKPQQKGPTI